MFANQPGGISNCLQWIFAALNGNGPPAHTLGRGKTSTDKSDSDASVSLSNESSVEDGTTHISPPNIDAIADLLAGNTDLDRFGNGEDDEGDSGKDVEGKIGDDEESNNIDVGSLISDSTHGGWRTLLSLPR